MNKQDQEKMIKEYEEVTKRVLGENYKEEYLYEVNAREARKLYEKSFVEKAFFEIKRAAKEGFTFIKLGISSIDEKMVESTISTLRNFGFKVEKEDEPVGREGNEVISTRPMLKIEW